MLTSALRNRTKAVRCGVGSVLEKVVSVDVVEIVEAAAHRSQR
jgi:hypothetical protein